MKLNRLVICAAFVGATTVGARSAAAQNTLDEFLYKSMKLTPARNHSSEFVPGALIEVALDRNHTKWQVIDVREKEKRVLTPPDVEELTATEDPFETNKPTNFTIGFDSIKQVFGGTSLNVGTQINHAVAVSEIKEKGYVLAGTGDQDLLASGKLHDWLLKNYITYPKSGVAYFMIKRVYTAQYAEIKADQGFNVVAALGGKDTGKCSDVKLPEAISNTQTTPHTPGTTTPTTTTTTTTPTTASTTPTHTTTTPGTSTPEPGTSGTGSQTKSSVHIGGTFCHPDLEHVRFYAAEWAPIALEVELITRLNDTLDVKPGLVVLPLYDPKETAKIADKLF